MNSGSKKILALVSATSGVSLLILVLTTTPSSVGLLGVFLLFVLLYLTCIGLFFLLLSVIRKIVGLFSTQNRHNRSLWGYAVSGSFLPLILLSLQSFGRLNVFSTVASVLVVAIIWFLLSRR
jgi:hypothetical protein